MKLVTLLPLCFTFGTALTLSGQIVITSNSDFEGSMDTGFGDVNWANPGVWRVADFNDRSKVQSTGGAGDNGAYISGSIDGSNKAASIMQVIDITGIQEMDGSNDLTLSFDVLNNSSIELSYDYEIFFANNDANGSIGSATALPTNRSPYAFVDNENFTLALGSVSAAASSGWTSSGSITIPFSSISFPGTFNYNSGGSASTTIADYSDITRIIVGIQLDNSPSDTAPVSGLDNVVVSVPEPSVFAALTGLGVLGLVLLRRRLQ